MNKIKIFQAILFSCVLVMASSNLGQAQPNIEVGSTAPAFTATDDMGREWKSEDLYGKGYLIIYFYPAAMTGGCTTQACSFRDQKSKLNELGAAVIGISGDKVENLKYFSEAHDLNFPLLADPDGEIAKKFGVPVKEGGSIKKTINNEEVTLERGVTISRWTFVVDESGKIVYKKPEVNPVEDSKEVVAFLESQQDSE